VFSGFRLIPTAKKMRGESKKNKRGKSESDFQRRREHKIEVINEKRKKGKREISSAIFNHGGNYENIWKLAIFPAKKLGVVSIFALCLQFEEENRRDM